MNAFCAGRDGHDSKAIEAKTCFVDGLSPGCLVGEKLSIERSLGKVVADYRHRSPIGFKKEKGAFERTTFRAVFQGEHFIRHDSDVDSVLEIYAPMKRCGNWLLCIL